MVDAYPRMIPVRAAIMIQIFQGNGCAIIDTNPADRHAMISGFPFSRGATSAMNVRGITKSRDQPSGIVVPKYTPITVETCQLAQSVIPVPSKW
mgnify:CR=1 FL=1